MASDLAPPAARVDDAVLRASLDAIISIDAYGVVLEFNPAAERMFGYVRGDVLGADMAQLVIPPAGREPCRRALRRLLAGGREELLEQRVELEAQRADGARFPVGLAITRLAGAGPTALYTGFVRDLTDHKRAEQERHERIGRQALVLALGQTALGGAAPPDLVAHALATLVDGLAVERGVALEVEAAGSVRREAAIGLGPLAGHGEPAGEAQAQLLHRAVAADGSLLMRGAELAQLADGGLSFAAGMGALLCVTWRAERGAVSGLLAIAATDATALGPADVGFAHSIANVVGTAAARWRADEEIARLGLHDPLTGLANRPLFENRLEQALERSRRGQGETGLLLVDLDGFGKLNDGFGHRIGDEVLVGVGVRLAGMLPAEATLGRLGGDDFGVLVPDAASEAQLLELGHHIGSALGEPMLAGGRELRTTASVGVVLTERGVGTTGELMRTAAAAVIRARERGGGRAERADQGMRRRSEPASARPVPTGPADAAPAPTVVTPNGARDATATPPTGATLSLGRAAEALGISTTTTRRWADDGRLGVTRTAGGHRRFAVSDVRRLLAARGSPAIVPTEPPRRALPSLAQLAESHGTQLAELSWRTLYGELRTGFFIDPACVDAAERWLEAIASAAQTANYGMLHEATGAFMRVAEQAGASLLERHLAIERFAETTARALTRRSCPREELVEVRRLFVSLHQRQLADAG